MQLWKKRQQWQQALLQAKETQRKRKNNFVNNISFNNENTFFLNTYGSLYSIRNNDMKINWFINLNQSNDINPSNLFYGNEVISRNNKIVVTSNRHTYILDSENGSIISKKNFTSIIKPLIVDKYVFFITKNNDNCGNFIFHNA